MQKKIKSLCYVTLGGSVVYQLVYIKKDFTGYYDQVLQPISLKINPEWAHKIGVSAIKYGFFPPQTYKDPEVLVRYSFFSQLNKINNIEFCNRIFFFTED